MTTRRPCRENASTYAKKGPLPEHISSLPGAIPVTDEEIRLILAMLGDRIAEIFADEQGV